MGLPLIPYLQFKKDLKETAEKILTQKYIDRQGIFNYDYIKRILDYPAHSETPVALQLHLDFSRLAIWEDQFIHHRTDDRIESYYK